MQLKLCLERNLQKKSIQTTKESLKSTKFLLKKKKGEKRRVIKPKAIRRKVIIKSRAKMEF